MRNRWGGSVVDELEEVGADAGDGYAADTFEGHHDTAVFLHAADFAFHSLENAVDDADASSGLVGEVIA